ncbi:hypothetical protein ANTRET_LOCUS4327 [Anthophora retusa]
MKMLIGRNFVVSEATSADVAGSKTSSEAVEVFRAAKFSPATTASSTATTASSPSSIDVRMVASTHNLDDLSVSHPASASNDRQQQQEKHSHTYRSAQTAQDKRSRLSNVINNLRKKVPDSRNGDSQKKEEDDRNSVERNLETLEKYVMTVLNGVIKDEEDDREVGRKKEAEKSKEPEKLAADQEDEDSKGPAAKFEPSKPNESRTEAAVFSSEQPDKPETKEFCLEHQNPLRNEETNCSELKDSQESLSDIISEERESSKLDNSEEDEVCKGGKCSSKEAKSERLSVQDTGRNNSQEEEKKESRSLGTIIMERLSENQAEEKGNVDATKEDSRDYISENMELRNVCRDLLNDLLNGINQLIDENNQEKEETRTLDSSLQESKDSRSQDFFMTSLHCSLPLDKVASVLQNCQTNELTVPQSPSSPSSSQGSKSPCKLPSPTVRHLCLYCDRKFMSISLRQRHTERVHQQGGGRRSERNSRKPSQNCQYCSDKCAESLEGLFQHMVGSHGDKYHGCLQCSTRYLTREALVGHMSENHGVSVERSLQFQEKTKESSPCKELGNQISRELPSPKERRSEELDHEYRAESILLKPMLPVKDTFSNPGSPEFDSSFYSSVSCNIRENLLHHLDGKLQSSSSNISSTNCSTADNNKPQQQPQQQSFYEHNVNQIQFPIDISLTAATPVYSKEYTNEEYENSSEYAQKPGKSNRSHPRRVSFEKYNFPRKYDGKEQWTCSIKDLSKFDISTQLSLRKKQQLLKERLSLNRLHHVHVPSETTDISQDEQKHGSRNPKEPENMNDVPTGANQQEIDQKLRFEISKSMENKSDCSKGKSPQNTEFSIEFGSFLRLRKWDKETSVEAAKKQEVVYAELTGEWSRPRIYICGACATRHVTLKEMEDHKVISHPNVWCSHFEFSGDQRELYKHLFLPGKDIPTAKARAAILAEKICTKCSKNCTTLPELHRHMLECGGDQAWLLGLFGNGKKKCKWRPFGSRSRRRRQRGMKRNIQNSQTPRVNTPKEKQPTGPRVRPSDRESIQKMLANLPPKRATRKVLQDSTLRTQGRLRNVQTRTRPRMIGDNSSASRLSRNKAALRNKLLKNAKSIQRNRCRIDNISAVIESVVRNYSPEDKKSDVARDNKERNELDVETKEKPVEQASTAKDDVLLDEKGNRTKVARGPRVLGKKRNVKTKEETMKGVGQVKRTGSLKTKAKAGLKNPPEAKADPSSEATRSLKTSKTPLKSLERMSEAEGSETSLGESKSPTMVTKSKSSNQTTPKRKRPVDPVASLNASIKAKSQLRTQDGKFARNPNKDASPQKSPEIKSPVSGRSVAKGKGIEASPESSVTRSKLRAVSRYKNGEQLPKRSTRLSSDSDKMPTLEPAVQFSSNGEEYAETSANDLPILSPATPASNPEKLLRGKHLVSKTLNMDEKDNSKKSEDCEEKEESGGNVQGEEKEQKQGKGRKAKGEVRNFDKSLEAATVSKEVFKGVSKEKFKRKSAPGKMMSVEEKKAPVKGPEEVSLKKEMRQKKEEGKLETRSNAKAKLDKVLDDDSPIKIQNVPFEVKKLIGSDSKEDLLTKLVLTSRVATSKRCLRQPVPKLRPENGKGKVKRDSELEKGKLDSGSVSDASTKKEKLDARRKSLRSTDKRDKAALKGDKMILDEVNKIKDAVSEVKTAIRGRRSSSLSNDSKSMMNSNQTLLSDSQSKPEVEVTTQNTDKRQTRGSLLNSSEGDAQNEVNDVLLKKNSLGKRRGRIKSSNDTLDKRNSEMSQGKSEEIDKNTSSESFDESKSDEKDNVQLEEVNVAKNRQEKDDKTEKELAQTSDPSENCETGKVNLNLNHLQVETGNSVDSGKENSLDTRAPVQKLKVGRPRKSWGAKKERASKRSLNNVIGILTEGMNIPVETQQNVLNVQVTSDSANPDESLQNSNQESCDDSSKSQTLEKNNKSSENSVPHADKLNQEIPPVQNVHEQSPEVPKKDLNIDSPSVKSQKIESPSKDTKDQSLANDIILDLSRRKPKGKGSFLEKIVSKIAKQKDALLEGEVGSLLDTAADELTSILDEVGTGFPESSENVVNKTRTVRKVEDIRQETEQESIEENCQDVLAPKLSDKSLENNKTQLETEEKKLILKEEELSKERPDQKGVKDDFPSQEATDRQCEIELPSKTETSTTLEVQNDSKVQDVVGSEESSLVPNGIQLPVPESVPETPLNDSTGVFLPKEDETVKKSEDPVVEDTKVRRKSKKRSLEGNSPKKSKRKSMEPAENSEELHVIEKSKQVPSTKENVDDDSSSEVSGERVQCGKRKSITDEPETMNSEVNVVVEDVQIIEDPNENSKKVKVDSGEDTPAEIAKNDIENPVGVTKNKDEAEKCSSLLKITGKRKSYVEAVDQYSEVESSVRRSSKRRSLQEEKANQSTEEDTVPQVESEVKESFMVEETSEDVRGLRRRSSRTKSMLQVKQIENDPVISISNIVPTEDSELPVKDSSEKNESSRDEVPVVESVTSNALEEATVVEESVTFKNTENQGTNKESIVQNAPMVDSKEPQKVEEPPVVPKVPKKRGRKKKCQIIDQTQTQANDSQENSNSKLENQTVKPDIATSSQLPPRRSLRTSRINEETEDQIHQSKNSGDLTNMQIASPSLEPFKVPEVTEVLQHTKKRTYKRRSTTDDYSDSQSNCTVAQPEVNNAECPEVSKNLVEKEEQPENSSLKEPSESSKRSSRSSNGEQLDLERSSSSGSIDLTQSNKMRSSKRKQLSSEDLRSGQESFNQRAESADNLSETSCASESSYFRKKRFSKRKKEFQEPPEDVQTDTSVTDSESVDTEKSMDRRASLKRRAKKNISFFEEFDLVDDFDIPMDIQDLILSGDTVFNRAKEAKESPVEEKMVEETSPSEVSNQNEESEQGKEKEIDQEESKKSPIEEEEEDEEDEEKDDEKGDSNADSVSQAQDEFQTPKKRTAGNYVVVHKKTGEILIVEKRKKLTKEAAKFFCDVCTTSFTRKSSLKKHNQSQSHLLQVAKFRKEKTCTEDNENIEGVCNANHNDISSDENKSVTDEVINLSLESKTDKKEIDILEPIVNQNDLEPVQSNSCYINPLEQESLMDSQTAEQHILEDELLDEEICKITENMSHDEYVLTDHVSPELESTSTPIKMEIKKVEEEVKKKKHEKKKDKTKKKSLTDEEIALDSPELETPSDSTLVTVLGANMSIKIAKSSHLNILQPNFDTKDVLQDSGGCCSFETSSVVTNEEPKADVLTVKESEFKEKCSEYLPTIQGCEDVDLEIENTILRSETSKIMDNNKGYQLDPDEKTENPFEASFEDRDSKERQPHERLSLKFTINKRGIEQCKEIDSESKRSLELNYSNDEQFVQVEPVNEINHFETEGDPFEEDLSLSLSKTLRKESRSLENLEELNITKVQNLEDTMVDLVNSIDQETPVIAEEPIQVESEPLKALRYGKSKKNKGKKHQETEEPENNSEDKIGKKSSKSKSNQNKLVFDEVTKPPEIVINQNTFEKNEKSECVVYESQLEINFDKITSPVQTENESEHESKGLEIIEEPEAEKFYEIPEPETPEEVSLKQSVDVQQIPDENKFTPFQSIDDDEISSSSSLADKPLSQLLLDRDEKVESSVIFLKDSDDEPKPQGEPEREDIHPKTDEYEIDENSMDTNELIDNQKSDDKELTNSDQAELQIVSEEESEHETELKTAEESEKEFKISSEPENSETVPAVKSVFNEKQFYDTVETKPVNNSRKSNNSDRQSLSKKASRAHKYSNKDNHKKSKNKEASIRNKIAELTSESDDSENEDKIESQNKSKIVKSVFGRVFGSEKTDKVKEVLNDWVSKSEDDSESSRIEFGSSCEVKIKDPSESRNDDKNIKKHSVSSFVPSSPKKRSAKRSKKSSSSDRAKEKSSIPENQEEHRSDKHTKSKSSSSNKKKHETDGSNVYFLVQPSRKCRPSKKRAEELISRTFENDFIESNTDKSQKSSKHWEANYGLRNQGKPDLTMKDSGYGSFNYDEDSTKVIISPFKDPTEDDQKITKRRKSSSSRKSKGKADDENWRELVIDKKTLKNSKESEDEEDCFIKEHPQIEPLTSGLSVDLESSQSHSSLAPSSVRNRSPSMDRNSQTTRDSDVDEEEEEDLGHRRISPLFICGTPESSIESSSNSENEEEDENVTVNGVVTRKRTSSEFSVEKIVIKSPSSMRKGEVVTIAPTDAIEDNALDVPQEIESAKPRQGKVLNFDEELFVECCSRLKATTENELRGAKKIKLDHNEGYHRKDDQQQGFRGPRDRWRDVESQNSLGSLLESVNQLLGEEMYSTRERDYPKRGGKNLRSEHSSRSASPDMSRADNLGYEDSLDVAFEHNNKLRDKIQQRMRESENLIASTFGQKSSNEMVDGEHSLKSNEQNILRNTYSHLQEQRYLSGANLSNGGYNDTSHVKSLQEQQGTGKMNLDSSGALKSKMNSSLGGLLDKALSNLLHSNEKHDHNGSTPMKVLAELACARAPTSTNGEQASQEVVQSVRTTSMNKDLMPDPNPIAMPKDLQKKTRNPIKELFERKKEMNDRKQQEKSKTEAALRELNLHRQRKTKKTKKHQDFPLIRRGEHGGLAERKKRRDGFERKEEFVSDRIKDVYEFDEEESQMEPNLGSVMSYRSRSGYEVSCLKTKEVDVAGLMSKAIGDSLENGKTGDALSSRLESMIDRKFRELEKFAPKTKGALKAFQSEDQQRQITGPMDEFVERKQPKGKKTAEPTLKHSKLKKRSKNPKKKTRNAWYENDSSDEYRTAVKAEDVGVGISKSQRTCSKGKQNIFAELYTSSESEFEDEDVDYESRRQRRVKKTTKKATELQNVEQSQQSQEPVSKFSSENEDNVDDWRNEDLKDDTGKRDSDNKKSESEMSDHPLVIDERKDVDEQRNSDEEIENQYERNFEMDDLYREDSSVVDSDVEDPVNTVQPNVPEESGAKRPHLPQEKIDNKTDYMQENELIPLEEALDLLDQADNETSLETKYGNMNRNIKPVENIDTMLSTEPEKELFTPVEEPIAKSPTPVEEQEEEPDNDLLALPEKLSSNEKPQKESENLPLHVFLSRKVQESKKRKEQQLKKMQEEQERILMDFQPTRRQRKCAIGKQGLLAEISSSDEETSPRDKRTSDRSDHDKPRKQKRESKEKRKERYIEKKHEQMIAKEQKAIEEEILREVGKKKESLTQNTADVTVDVHESEKAELTADRKVTQEQPAQKKKHQTKDKQKKQNKTDEDVYAKSNRDGLSDLENNCNKSVSVDTNHESENKQEYPAKQKHSKSPTKPKKAPKGDTKVTATGKRNKSSNADKKNKTDSRGSKDKERRSSSGRRDSDDEELKTTKSWNKVEEGVGVAIGRRKRAAANQLYYWSSSSDEEEMLEVIPAVEEEEDDRQEQHGWIVGDSHKRMITMLAMEKQLKEKRRRSEDEFEPGRAKSKKHRNSTS